MFSVLRRLITERAEMSQIERIGVSVEKNLLAEFDRLIEQIGYRNRSEAFRDLIREKLSRKRLEDKKAIAIATIFLIYDHHTAHISNIFKDLGTARQIRTISSVHVYIDHNNCLEVVIVKGRVADIKKLGEKMISMRGVKQGEINLVEIADEKR